MHKLKSSLTIALLFTALTVFTFFITGLLTLPIGFLYRDAAGLGAARSIAQYGAILAALGLVIAAGIVAVEVAMRPGGWGRKLLYVLPIFLLGLTVVGGLLNVAGIGTTGTLRVGLGLGLMNLSTLWLVVCSILALIAVIVAAARMPLNNATLSRAMKALGVTAVPLAIAWLGLVGTLLIVATTQPSLQRGAFGGGDGGRRGGPAASGQTAPGAQGAPVAQGAQGVQGAPGGAAGSGAPAAAGGSASPGAQPGSATTGGAQARPGGQRGPGGPGGPGGGLNPATLVRQLALLCALVTVFGAIALTVIVRSLRVLRGTEPAVAAMATDAPPPDTRREAGRAVVAALVIGVVALAAIQLVPVSRDNPPVKTEIAWNSSDTQDLWGGACADCHSNETRWPWYANVAPTSWLTTMDAHSARNSFNLSDLDSMQPNRRQSLPDDLAQRLKNGSMPPREYQLMHPAARLTDAQRLLLAEGMKSSLPPTQ